MSIGRRSSILGLPRRSLGGDGSSVVRGCGQLDGPRTEGDDRPAPPSTGSR